jgi:hypothetical protein
MTRTRPTTLLLFAIVGATAGWLLEIALVAMGATVIVPPLSLGGSIGVIGVVVVGFALPVRNAVKEHERARLDPFYASRVVVLAKASSIAGALLAGATMAILIFLLTRSVVAGVGSILMAVAAVAGSVVLVVGGLVAEYMCSVPHDGDDDGSDKPATTKPS